MTAVTTTSGVLNGNDLGAVRRFAGIRYAEAPVGDRRFRPPAAYRSSGPVGATTFGPTAWQPASALEVMLGGNQEERSEDCLLLNVWAPSNGIGQAADRPVMVWIHGGGFSTGSGSSPIYDGANLAARGDTVVVTINYRLGPLGFLHLDHLDAGLAGSGNLGLLDQLAALDWVQENISAFGGNPDNVTIFGESAGAMSVASLLAIAGDRGRFHRVIAQSGGVHNLTPTEVAEQTTANVIEAAGAASVDDLMTIDPATLIAAGEKVRGASGNVLDRINGAHELGPNLMVFQPVLDGKVITEPLIDSIRGGAGRSIALLTGVNADEWNLFDPTRKPLPAERLSNRLERLAAKSSEPAAATSALAAAYGLEVDDSGMVDRSVQSSIMTDAVFRMPAVRMLEARAESGAPGHHYQFSWASPVAGGLLGSCHALELPFVFGTIGAKGMSSFVGENPPGALSEQMQDTWLHFARHGTPGNDHDDFASYDAGTRTVYDFGGANGAVEHPNAERTNVWSGLL